MKLRHSSTSPYVRKVMILAHETGLDRAIKLVPTTPWAKDTDLPADNPLGKVPALITDDGEHLYDSPVICEYLDSLHQGVKRFPPAGAARWTALRRQALADGILDATVSRFLEMARRPAEFRWAAWAERQAAAIGRALDTLEGEVESFTQDFTIGEIAVTAALGYLDFRFPEGQWRNGRPELAAWYAAQEARPSVAATVPRE